jgi:hypothetical protein
LLATYFQAGILLALFDHEDGDNDHLKRSLTFNGLHGVIFQKTVDKEELLKCLEKTKASDNLASTILLMLYIPNDGIKC